VYLFPPLLIAAVNVLSKGVACMYVCRVSNKNTVFECQESCLVLHSRFCRNTVAISKSEFS